MQEFMSQHGYCLFFLDAHWNVKINFKYVTRVAGDCGHCLQLQWIQCMRKQYKMNVFGWKYHKQGLHEYSC